ncbi:hypothetical protein WG66_003714 [Moniliophthora roreri]|nr:hypothetical protein WG66_003714 [Moniliophthora roreri]
MTTFARNTKRKTESFIVSAIGRTVDYDTLLQSSSFTNKAIHSQAHSYIYVVRIELFCHLSRLWPPHPPECDL